ATTSGLLVKNDPIALRTLPSSSSLPRPRPGSPRLLLMTVRLPAVEWVSRPSIRVRGAPTRPNPPTITVAPSGIRATASATPTMGRSTSVVMGPADHGCHSYVQHLVNLD